MPDRPANCPTCDKRLSRKQWYYRNGQYFCKKGCWQTAQAKAKQEEAAKKKEASGPAKEAPAKTEAPAEAAAPSKESKA